MSDCGWEHWEEGGGEGRGGEGQGKSITEKLEVKEEQRLLLFFFYSRHMVSLDVALVAVHVSTQS